MSRGRNTKATQVAKPALVALGNLDFDRGNCQRLSGLQTLPAGSQGQGADHSVSAALVDSGICRENYDVETVSESFRFFFFLPLPIPRSFILLFGPSPHPAANMRTAKTRNSTISKTEGVLQRFPTPRHEVDAN